MSSSSPLSPSSSPSSCTTATRPRPHLLHIPGELRNRIYSELLFLSSGDPAHTFPIHIDPKETIPCLSPERTPVDLALSQLTPLLQTCRQVHLEASTLFYSCARFGLPPKASQAPHQAQVNLVLRAFLDRIGPRNAASVRHLVAPFPVDPDTFVANAFRKSSNDNGDEYGGDEYYDDNDDGKEEAGWSLIPALRRRCPALETLTIDLRGNNGWLQLLAASAPGASTARRLFARLAARLRAAFPQLRRVDVWLTGCDQTWSRTGIATIGWAGISLPVQPTGLVISSSEWKWLRAAVGEGEGEGGRDDARGGSGGGGYETRWYGVPHPRPATHVLYGPPANAVRSVMHDHYTIVDVVWAYVRFGFAWLRSPSKAALDREEAIEWKRWRRAMLANAAPVGSGFQSGNDFKSYGST
ncbi:hypothetical protein C7999DRAFT_44251 [Corynascus novoguineensis]|uniref:Uncharacterized protein n=1 Tax=Corynascus novoguineensis TaxID=1126955 RepID=A0AAN7CN05_9PEZI|nr:hypothetical protein C7999DRAFT_44251 [Corynascus novoguineensis]